METTQLRQRAVEAAIWGMPIVSVDAMRQALFRDARATYHDIAFCSKPADWKLQIPTPNASTRYVYFNINTAGGPIVIDVPAAVGAGLFGSVLDAWQVPLADVGPAGADRGEGGRYLLLPPGHRAEVPEGYITLRLRTFNGYGALRAIPDGPSEGAIERALALVRQLRVYPLAQAGAPPPQRFVDLSDRLFDGIVRFDESFYASLARMVHEEPPLPRDAAVLAQLAELGIEKGRPFAPDSAMRHLLRDAARDAHAWFMRGTPVDGNPFWPDRAWRVMNPIAAKTGFSFEAADGRLDVEARALVFFLACAPPARLGEATRYLFEWVDGTCEPLSGDRIYRLRVPPRAPARQFWAVTAYDASTAAFFREAPRVELSSYHRELPRAADGTIELYFGPRPPAGKQASWIYTAPGQPWFAAFRLYGPEPPLFDQAWKLPDLERLKP